MPSTYKGKGKATALEMEDYQEEANHQDADHDDDAGSVDSFAIEGTVQFGTFIASPDSENPHEDWARQTKLVWVSDLITFGFASRFRG
jgi:hypothetical protein